MPLLKDSANKTFKEWIDVQGKYEGCKDVSLDHTGQYSFEFQLPKPIESTGRWLFEAYMDSQKYSKDFLVENHQIYLEAVVEQSYITMDRPVVDLQINACDLNGEPLNVSFMRFLLVEPFNYRCLSYSFCSSIK